MLEMYNFLGEHEEFPREEDDQWYPMGRMIATAFSLWRSAFLTNVSRSRPQIYAQTKEFVCKVLEQNAITFADDYRMDELTVDYYNSNARYRLERMYEKDETPEYFKQLESLRKIYDLRNDDVERMNQRELWECYYKALRDSFDAYEQNWNKKIRPARSRARRSSARIPHDQDAAQ
jgi:hypothetical protein